MVGELTSGNQRELFKTPVLSEKTQNFPPPFIDHSPLVRDRISLKEYLSQPLQARTNATIVRRSIPYFRYSFDERQFRMSGSNPYAAGSGGTSGGSDPSSLSTVDWVIAILCSGIGCIIGIVRLVQGKPNGGKMLGISLGFAVFWNVVSFVIQMLLNNAAP